MGGSTGIFSNVGASPITSYGEDQRQADLSIQGMPHANEQIRQVIGIIDEINPDKPRLVRAHEPSGALIADGLWIELNHSADEIAERWGTIQTGFRIRATIQGGGNGTAANATIIGVEGSDVSEPFTANEVERGLYLVFSPGGTGL